MLWTLAVIFIAMWLVGMITAFTFSGFIHILLLLALVTVLLQIFQGRRPLT